MAGSRDRRDYPVVLNCRRDPRNNKHHKLCFLHLSQAGQSRSARLKVPILRRSAEIDAYVICFSWKEPLRNSDGSCWEARPEFADASNSSVMGQRPALQRVAVVPASQMNPNCAPTRTTATSWAEYCNLQIEAGCRCPNDSAGLAVSLLALGFCMPLPRLARLVPLGRLIGYDSPMTSFCLESHRVSYLT